MYPPDGRNRAPGNRVQPARAWLVGTDQKAPDAAIHAPRGVVDSLLFHPRTGGLRPGAHRSPDGASISLVFTGEHHWASGLVLIAPHVFVEAETIAGIEKVVRRFETTDLVQRMAKYHPGPGGDVPGVERDLAGPRLSGLEHRILVAQHPLSRLGHPGSRRRVRDPGSAGGDRARCQRPGRKARAP